MMNDFGFFQLAFEVFLHDEAVFEDAIITSSHIDVTIVVHFPLFISRMVHSAGELPVTGVTALAIKVESLLSTIYAFPLVLTSFPRMMIYSLMPL